MHSQVGGLWVGGRKGRHEGNLVVGIRALSAQDPPKPGPGTADCDDWKTGQNHCTALLTD